MIEALRRTGVRFALVGAVAYVVFLVATLPASWVDYALERATGGALALGDSSGTVWKGRGTLAAKSGDGFRAIGDIQWRSNPLSIFTGRLGVAITGTASGGDLKANASLGLRSVRLQNLEASVQVSAIEQAVPLLGIWKPQGRVRISADAFELGPASVRGAATAEWSDAGMSGIARVGDYRLQVTGNGDNAAIRLQTLRGDLKVSGDGQWRAAEPRVVQIRGVAEAPPARKDLEPLLTLLVGGGTGSTRQFGWMVDI
jgi:general secretion pathway protein N